MEILYLLLGLALGAVIIWLILKGRSSTELSVLNERERMLTEAKEEIRLRLEEEQNRAKLLDTELATAHSDLKHMQEKIGQHQQVLEETQERMQREFELLANRIFEEKSKKFEETNKTQLSGILDPLRERMVEFKDKVEQTYIKGTQERSVLAQQIKTLTELNQSMLQDANNLTRALKGDSKKQGNWGEVILERVLEQSGLVKDREYFTQESQTNEEGRRQQPDVIVRLPEDRVIIIDAKVSLTAYERYASSDDEAEQQQAIKEHILSIRAHLKGLSDKNYQDLYKVQSPDFVLMFIPIEPAFAIAIQKDANLYNEAFEKKIVMVSTSTLLATMQTIHSIWKREYQNKHALKIAEETGKLYDKFVGLVDDLEKVGRQMDTSKNSYVAAMKKLSEGDGNLVRKVEMIKQLGVRANKSLSESIKQRALKDETEPEEA